jgi:voltage-gated potassium channel
MNRKTLYNIIEKDVNDDRVSKIYDVVMVLLILLSIVPLMFIQNYPIFRYIELVTVTAFIADYILRWYTSDIALRYGWKSFLIYPFTPMAIIDLLSILPGLNILNPSLKLFRITRLFRLFRVFKFIRYSDKVMMFLRVLKKERAVLFSVLILALFYIFITALVMFNAEPHINPTTGEATFSSFFDALYWATVTLTTVGYGDLCPVTDVGRVVSMLSSLFGVAIIALPSGVITASYLEELKSSKKEGNDKNDSN